MHLLSNLIKYAALKRIAEDRKVTEIEKSWMTIHLLLSRLLEEEEEEEYRIRGLLPTPSCACAFSSPE